MKKGVLSVVVLVGLALSAHDVFAQESTFHLIDSQEVDLGERSIIYNRVEPPVLNVRPTPEVARESATVTSEMQEFIRRWESKRNVFLFVSATVYDHRVTEVRLPGGDGEYVLWSNIDFNHFRGLFEFETAETRYTFFLGIGDESSEVIERWSAEAARLGLPMPAQKPVPMTVPGPAGKSNYQFVSMPEPVPDVLMLQALDDLHEYYDANRERLKRQYEESEARQIAHAEWLRKNPPQPKDTTINFFPIRSVRGGQEPAADER